MKTLPSWLKAVGPETTMQAFVKQGKLAYADPELVRENASSWGQLLGHNEVAMYYLGRNPDMLHINQQSRKNLYQALLDVVKEKQTVFWLLPQSELFLIPTESPTFPERSSLMPMNKCVLIVVNGLLLIHFRDSSEKRAFWQYKQHLKENGEQVIDNETIAIVLDPKFGVTHQEVTASENGKDVPPKIKAHNFDGTENPAASHDNTPRGSTHDSIVAPHACLNTSANKPQYRNFPVYICAGEGSPCETGLIPSLLTQKFQFHHYIDEELLYYKWMGHEKDRVPCYGSTNGGIGA
jgi:hypothetical protein